MYETVIDGTRVTIKEVFGGILTEAKSPFEPHNVIRKFIKQANIPAHVLKLLEKSNRPAIDLDIESLEIGEPVLRKKLKRG